DRARRYVGELREVQPHGPYRLGGWSFGGCLAFEVAGQLTAAGERVALVALIDTIIPLPANETAEQDRVLDRYRRFVDHIERSYGVTVPIDWDELAALDEPAQIDRVLAALSTGDVQLPPAALRHQHTSYLDARAAERYRPRPWPGRVVLYRATDP